MNAKLPRRNSRDSNLLRIEEKSNFCQTMYIGCEIKMCRYALPLLSMLKSNQASSLASPIFFNVTDSLPLSHTNAGSVKLPLSGDT